MFLTVHEGGNSVAFDTLVIVLWAICALMAGGFVITWFPLAFRALAARRQDVSLLRIIDYAGLQLFVFLASVLTLRTMLTYGVVPARDEISVFTRIFLPAGISVLVALRLFRWGRHLWRYRRGGGDSALLAGVSKSSNTPGMPH